MSALKAPDGFLILGEVRDRYAEGPPPCSKQKAEVRIARDIAEGRLQMFELPSMKRLAPAEDQHLDFERSEVIGDGDERQVIYLHLGGFGEGADLPQPVSAEPYSPGVAIVLDVDDVNRRLDELAPRPGTAVTGAMTYQPPSEAAAAPGARPAHRPPSYDWPWYEAQVRRRVHQDGLPERSSILVREVMALFDQKVEDPPEQRTVERWVAKLWPTLQDLEGPCEIVPLSNRQK